MKMNFFFLFVLLIGFNAVTIAQSQSSAPATKNEAPAQAIGTDPVQTTTVDKADCKWVDANNDGKCDACGMTQSKCEAKCGPPPKKSGCASTCPMSKSCGENKAVAEPKDGRKQE